MNIATTLEEAKNVLAHRAPAALATTPHNRVSEAYSMIPTMPVVEAAYDHGLVLADAQQKRVRSTATNFDADSATHILRFRRLGQTDIGGSFPEVCVINGHARTTSFKVLAGLLREICTNGLISGDYSESRVRHIGDVDMDLDALFTSKIAESQQLVDQVSRYTQVDARLISGGHVHKLVDAGIKARWSKWEDVPQNDKRCARDFLETRRRGDHAEDLWTRLNVIQENLVRGTRRNWSRTGRRVRKIRACTDILTQTKISQALFSKADEIVLAS